jgi:thiol-disulfide isomerase/thioredoxin
MFDNKTDTETVKQFESVAKEGQWGVLFAKADPQLPNAQTFAGMFEKSAEKLPILGGFKVRDQRLFKFKLTKKLTKESIRQFITDFSEDKLAPFFKNGPRKETEQGRVGYINRQQHSALQHKSDTNLVVGYVAKWCSYCHEVKKMFEEVLKMIKREKDRFQFLIVDLDENDIDDLDQSKIPVVRVWGRSDDGFQMYSGLREADVFLEWVENRDGKSYHDRKMPKSVADEMDRAKTAFEQSNVTPGDSESNDEGPATDIEKELERISRMSTDL